MNYNLVSNILGGKWLIDPAFAQANQGLILSILKGGSQLENIQDKKEQLNQKLSVTSARFVQPSWDNGFRSQEMQEGSIAVVSVFGAIMKNSGMCNTGSMEMAQWVKEADQNPKISTILIIVDSPGGMVGGTSTFGDAIKNSKTKTIGFIEDGMAASAGYWPLAGTDEIWSSHSINMVGSIGVYLTLSDMKGYFEKEGLKIHEVYSKLSTEKNEYFAEALKGNYKPLQEGVLDPIAESFIAHVKEGRGEKLNISKIDPFKGGIYTSEIALQIGLIDRIGSLEELLGEIESPQNSNQFSQSNKTNMKFKSAWQATMSALGFANATSDDEAPAVTEERLEQLNSSLEAANSELADSKSANEKLQGELKEANSAKESAEKRVSTLEAENKDLQSKVEKFGSQPGATHEVPKKGNEDLGEKAEEEISETDAEVKKMRSQFNYN